MKLSRRITAVLLAALLGGLAALIVRQTLSPARHVLRADLSALVIDGCRGSRILFDEVTADPDVRDVLLLAPLNGYDQPFGKEVCRETLRVLSKRGVWSVGMLPERWACDWMATDLRAAMEGVMNENPAFLRSGNLLRVDEIELAMQENGLDYKPSRDSHGIRSAKLVGGW